MAVAAPTLGELVTGSVQLADMSGDDFVTAAQWRLWVNEALMELHGIVSTAYQDTFFSTSDITLTAAEAGQETLPTDFMRMRGLDRDPDTAQVKTIRRFNWSERNSVGRMHHYSRFHRSLRYRIVSRTKLFLEPTTEAAGNYRLYYVKRPILTATTPTATWDATVMQDELTPWYEYVHVVVAIKALTKKEADTSALMARAALIRQDIEASAPTDENESDTVVDVEDGWEGDLVSATVGGGGGEAS